MLQAQKEILYDDIRQIYEEIYASNIPDEVLTNDKLKHLQVEKQAELDRLSQGITDAISKVVVTPVETETIVISPLIIEVEAFENIPKYSLVTSTGKVANSNDLRHAYIIVGIAIEDTTSRDTCKVQILGELTNTDWLWGSGDLFLNGTVLSQIAPSVGFIKNIATIKSANTIIIKLEDSIIL